MPLQVTQPEEPDTPLAVTQPNVVDNLAVSETIPGQDLTVQPSPGGEMGDTATPVSVLSSAEGEANLVDDKTFLDETVAATTPPIPEVPIEEPPVPEVPAPEPAPEPPQEGFTLEEAMEYGKGNLAGFTKTAEGKYVLKDEELEKLGMAKEEPFDNLKAENYLKSKGFSSSQIQNILNQASDSQLAMLNQDKWSPDIYDLKDAPGVPGVDDGVQRFNDQIETLVNDLDSYNVDTDPAYQAHAQGIRDKFAKIQADMEKTNSARESMYRTLGMRTGAAQFANAIAEGITGEEIKQGNDRIAEINRQEQAAISQAKIAFEDRNYTNFSRKVDTLRGLRDDKAKALENYNKKLENAQKAITDANDFEFKKLDYQIKLREIELKEKEAGKVEFKTVAPGTAIMNPQTGEIIGTAPPKPTDPMDYIKSVGDSLLSYNPETGGFDVLYTKPKEGETLSTMQKIDMAEKGWTIGADGEPVQTGIVDTEKITTASSTLNAIDDLFSIADGDFPVGSISSALESKIPGTKASDFKIKFEALIGSETLKNMGLIKGILSDSDMKLLKSASTGGLDMNLSADLFKEQLYRLRNIAVSVLNSPKMSINDVVDNGDGTYSYKNNNGTVHTGFNNDGYEDPTTRSASTPVGSQGNAQKDVATTFNDWFINTAPDSDLGKIQLMLSDTNLGSEEERKKAVLERYGIAFNQSGGGTLTATVAKAFEQPSGSKGGQCGRYVNKYTDLGVGDSYQSKMNKMDSSITQPEPGMVFVMEYKNTGHIGYVMDVKGNQVQVKDSNWGLDEKVATHWIDRDKITGLRRV